ncbi:MAG: hypothetical protein SO116_05120 [Treponema sp.]|nr:hypothetical protein [Treponema sp.]
MKPIVTKITATLFALMMATSLASCGKKLGKGDVYRQDKVYKDSYGDDALYGVTEIRFLNDKDFEIWGYQYFDDTKKEDRHFMFCTRGIYTVDEKAFKVKFLDESDNSVYEGYYSDDLSVLMLEEDPFTFKKVSK